MALNAYLSEQRIFYSDELTSCYGFHVTGTYFADNIHPFGSEPERTRFVEAVRGSEPASRNPTSSSPPRWPPSPSTRLMPRPRRTASP